MNFKSQTYGKFHEIKRDKLKYNELICSIINAINILDLFNRAIDDTLETKNLRLIN